MTQEETGAIRAACLTHAGTDPAAIAQQLMAHPAIAIHGPAHHFLDGAALLTALRNAGAEIDLPAALDELCRRAEGMPGAACGLWGVCGAAASVGAALSILHQTGPLSSDRHYGDHLRLTADILRRMGEAGGPRCCKRHAFLALSAAAEFVRREYGIALTLAPIRCPFSAQNAQCLGPRCPFHP